MNVMPWGPPLEKEVGRRVQVVLDDPDLFKAYQRFGGDILRRSSVFHGLRDFMNEIGIKGGTCVEIGTWHGLTAVVLSRFFDRVITLDIAHRDLKHEIIKHLGITNIECLDIEDNAEKAKIVKSLDFDFAYLDGDHAHDTESDFMLVKKCRRVLFHEHWWWQNPVTDTVGKLPYDEVTQGGFGLAFWDGVKR